MGFFSRKSEIQRDYDALIGDSASDATEETLELVSKINDDILDLTRAMVIKLAAQDNPGTHTRSQTQSAIDTDLADRSSALSSQDTESFVKQTDLNQTQDRISDIKADLNESRLKVRRQKIELNSALDQMTFLRGRLGQAQSDLQKARQDYQIQSVKLRDTETELNDVRERHLENLSRLTLTRAKLDEAHSLLNQADKTLAKRKVKLETSERKLSKTRRELETTQARLLHSEQRLDEAHILLRESDKIVRSRKDEISRSSQELFAARDDLGKTQYALMETRDALEIAQLKLKGLRQTRSKAKELRREIDSLKNDLLDAHKSISEREQTIQELSADQIGKRAAYSAQIESKEAEYKDHLIKARDELVRRQKKDEERQAEITLVNAKNRALVVRLQELSRELEDARPRPDVIPAALSNFRNSQSDTHSLAALLEKSRAKEQKLTEQIEKAEQDMAMMEDVNAMLRQKFAAFARPQEDSLEIPRWNLPS